MRTDTLMHDKDISERPLVTVITVTYNSAKFVRDAIESVLAQSYDNIEYIIGDDHSTDNTWDIIQGYKDPRIIAYRNEKNLGEYRNRNKAIEMAAGKYLIFIDGDDYIYPHGVEYFTVQMEKFPQAALAVQEGYTPNVVYPVLLMPIDVLKNFFFGSFNLLTSSFTSNFFNTEIIKSLGGLSEKFVSGDEELRMRLVSRYPVLFVQGWVSWPRETPGQASSRIHDGTGFVELVEMTNELLNNGTINDPELKDQIKKVLKRNAAFVVMKVIRSGKIQQARRIIKACGFSPFDVMRHIRYKPTIKDPLSHFNPGSPLKTKINERVREEIL